MSIHAGKAWERCNAAGFNSKTDGMLTTATENQQGQTCQFENSAAAEQALNVTKSDQKTRMTDLVWAPNLLEA